MRDQREWQRWQEYRPTKNDFNRPLIFSLIQFYHEPDIWLFGGVFRVLARHPDRYEVELTDQGASFLGRLKLRSSYRNRQTRCNMERHFDNFHVQEILREPYNGKAFPGFDDIDLTFKELATLIQNDRPDWRAALENMKGVYLITDTRSGRRYVGSAYGDQGIWARWQDYVETGHGGNIQLHDLVEKQGIDYCRMNFRFALLEHRTARTADKLIIDRESFWKRILLTRGDGGFNLN